MGGRAKEGKDEKMKSEQKEWSNNKEKKKKRKKKVKQIQNPRIRVYHTQQTMIQQHFHDCGGALRVHVVKLCCDGSIVEKKLPNQTAAVSENLKYLHGCKAVGLYARSSGEDQLRFKVDER